MKSLHGECECTHFCHCLPISQVWVGSNVFFFVSPWQSSCQECAGALQVPCRCPGQCQKSAEIGLSSLLFNIYRSASPACPIENVTRYCSLFTEYMHFFVLFVLPIFPVRGVCYLVNFVRALERIKVGCPSCHHHWLFLGFEPTTRCTQIVYSNH